MPLYTPPVMLEIPVWTLYITRVVISIKYAIKCLINHTLLITFLKVFVWGLNDKGQLGSGLAEAKVMSPFESRALAKLRPIQLVGGAKTLFIVSQDGKVHTFMYVPKVCVLKLLYLSFYEPSYCSVLYMHSIVTAELPFLTYSGIYNKYHVNFAFLHHRI